MRPDRDNIQVDPALSYGLTEYLRIQDMLRQHGWSSRRCIPAWRAPVLAAHRGRAQARRQRVLPGGVPAHRRVRRRRGRLGQPGRAHRDPRHRLRRQGRVLQGAARTAQLTAFRCPRCRGRAAPFRIRWYAKRSVAASTAGALRADRGGLRIRADGIDHHRSGAGGGEAQLGRIGILTEFRRRGREMRG